MAKEDFCFTYYDGDAARDMAHMNRLERGGYSDLIVSQRKFGHLSLEIIKKTLGSDFENIWVSIEIVLKKDRKGKYFIEWVDFSTEKTQKFAKKQQENGKKGGRPKKQKDNDIIINELDEENTDLIINPNESQTKAKKSLPSSSPYPSSNTFSKEKNKKEIFFNSTDENLFELPKIQTQAAREIFKLNKNHLLTDEEINTFWGIFKVQNVTGKKYYADVGDVYSHFINWIKGQNISNGTATNSNGNKRSGTSTDRIAAAKNW